MSRFLDTIQTLVDTTFPTQREEGDESEPLDWHNYFSCISLLVSTRSSCNRLHVGCVLVKDKRILATGYNGFLSGLPHQSVVRNNHEQGTVHAEQNAITFAAKNGICLLDSTAYVTHYPCLNCAKLLISAGIRKIFYLHDYKNDTLVQTFASQSGVEIKQTRQKGEITIDKINEIQ